MSEGSGRKDVLEALGWLALRTGFIRARPIPAAHAVCRLDLSALAWDTRFFAG